MVHYTKSCFGVFNNIELGGGKGETKFVLSMFNQLYNFVILAGMISRVLSKIVAHLSVLNLVP